MRSRLQAGGNGTKFGTSNGIDAALQLAAGAISPRKAHGRAHLHENFPLSKHDVSQRRIVLDSEHGITIRINLHVSGSWDMQSWPPTCHEDSHRSPHHKAPFTGELQQMRQRNILKHG